MKSEIIQQCFEEHARVFEKTKSLFPHIEGMASVCADALKQGNKILICGNGGSAADAQHIAAEFVGRFHNERNSLPALALTTDTSILTSVANDYSYDVVFSRQVEGLGNKGDVLWGISTSGSSSNVNRALETARQRGMATIGSTGKDGGNMISLCDEVLLIPSDVTARIQEMHMLCAHIICQILDEMDWSGNDKK